MPRDSELTVELPGGGEMQVQSPDEVDRWQTLADRYRSEYRLTKVNDLAMLDMLLISHLTLYRAQRALSGMEPEMDEDGLPTGRWKRVEIKPAVAREFQAQYQAASKEVRDIEKALGIDKKSREQSGDQTIPDYLARLKKFGHEYGVHVSERVHAYEEFVRELTWRLRLEQNGDAEDKAYENCTPDGILAWARENVEALEAVDKRFAQERGRLVVGTL